MELTRLQKKIIYEIIKIREEHEKSELSLRLTTLIKRFGYTNSIIAKLINSKIRKEAKDLEKKKIIRISFKSPDFYNPGEIYEGEAYNLIDKNIDEEQLVKPNYFFNHVLGILLNLFITALIIFLFFLIYLIFSSKFERIKTFFQSDNINRTFEIIANMLVILGAPFSIITFITKNKKD